MTSLRHPSFEPRLRERTRALLHRRGLVSVNLDDEFDRRDMAVRVGGWAGPSAHVDCWSPDTARRYHLRVLAWTNPDWRVLRRRCIADHLCLHRATARGRHKFRVPAIVEHRSRGLIWDLTDYADGYKIPWIHAPSPGRMQDFQAAARTLVGIGRDLQSIRVAVRQRTDWQEFETDFRGRLRSMRRRALLTPRQEVRLRAVIDADLPAATSGSFVLSHGDFNPTNVIFPYGAGLPWLIDWDHLQMSAPGHPFGRLWMFTSSDPEWQNHLLDELRSVLRAEAEWRSFRLFAAAEVLTQCDFLFTTTKPMARDISELRDISPAQARTARAYVRRLWTVLNQPIPGS